MFGFSKTHPATQFQALSEKWSERHKDLQERLWKKHGEAITKFFEKSKQWAVGTLAGLVMLGSSGVSSAASIGTPAAHEKAFVDVRPEMFFMSDLSHIVPKEVRPLTGDEEQRISTMLTNQFKMKIYPELEGKRLNTTYGYIGQEQHLARFPGDTIGTHFDTGEDSILYADKGMAPGLGAWGYFARSQGGLTEKENLREKYYIAVQTFLSPGYNDNPAAFNKFYQYRKMFIMNPENGKAMIVDVADAGPSPWTGKQLGGSPEVMKYLGRVDGAGKGPVLYFFINDPNDSIKLGPIDYNR